MLSILRLLLQTQPSYLTSTNTSSLATLASLVLSLQTGRVQGVSDKDYSSASTSCLGVPGDFDEAIFEDDDIFDDRDFREACKRGEIGSVLGGLYEITREGEEWRGAKQRADMARFSVEE